MKTILRTLATVALALYLGVTTTGLRVIRECIPTATATAPQPGEWWQSALASETDRWSTLARIGRGGAL